MKNKMTLSIKQMKHLESLGLDTSDASMCWIVDVENDYLGFANEYDFSDDDIIPVYTLQDILPYFNELCGFEDFEYHIHYNKIDEVYSIRLENPYHNETGDTLLECAFNTLVWCIENGYIKQINT